MDGEGGVVEGRQAGREAGPPRVVAIFVPPAVLQEVEAVFQPPVVADVAQEIRGRDLLGIEARDEVTHVVRHHFACGRAELAIDAQRYTATGQIERLTNVVRVVEIDPQLADFLESPLLSSVSTAGGRWAADAKQCCKASSVSP